MRARHGRFGFFFVSLEKYRGIGMGGGSYLADCTDVNMSENTHTRDIQIFSLLHYRWVWLSGLT